VPNLAVAFLNRAAQCSDAIAFRLYTDSPGVLQLCQPSESGAPQWVFLQRTGGGVFHIGFVVDNVDDASEYLTERGIEPWMWGRRIDRTGFTYFETAAAAGVTLEIRQSAAT
jgi:hypothetical protein